MILFAIVFTVFLLLALYLFPIIEVIGDSMYPTYKEGKLLLSVRVFFKSQLKVNDIYTFISPQGKLVIKRLKHISKEGCFFEGDNKEVSYDSRKYGYIKFNKIKTHIIGGKKL